MRWMAALSVAIALASPAAAESLSPAQLHELGQQIFSGRAREAQTKLEEMLLHARQTANPKEVGVCELLLGMAGGALSDHDSARRHFDEAQKAFADAGDRLAQSTTLVLRAMVELTAGGKGEEAVALFERALTLIDQVRESNAPLTFETLILLSVAMGSPEELPPFPLETIKPLILRGFTAFFRGGLGIALVEAGRLDEAEVQLSKASVDAILHIGFRDVVIEPGMGELRWRQWRFDEARDHFQKALAGAEELRNLPGARRTNKLAFLVRLTEIELLSGRVDAALEWNRRTLNLLRSEASSMPPAAALQYRAGVLARGNRLDEAATAFADALISASRQRDVHRECSIRIDLAVLEHLRGNPDAAIANIEKAIELAPTAAPELEKAAWITLAEIHLSGSSRIPECLRQSGPGMLIDAVDAALRRPLDAEVQPPGLLERGAVRRFMERQIDLAATMPEPAAQARLSSMALAVRGNAAYRSNELAASPQFVSRKRIPPKGSTDARLFREAETVRLQLEALEEQSGFRSQLEWGGVGEKDLERGRARHEALLSRLESSQPEYVSLIRAERKRLQELQEALPGR